MLRNWNRKLHFYVGLYFLLFVWLFAVSGLLLNHSQWRFAQFWEQRVETSADRPIVAPANADDVRDARELAAQLGLHGEIEQTQRGAGERGLRFRINRPGTLVDVRANFETGRAAITETRINGWGVMRALHAFTGRPANDPAARRDWLATTLWSVSMDAVAGGVVFLVLSGIYMWLLLANKRRLGLISIGLGTAACAFFVWGLKLF